jgi:hypothetical protein
LNQSNLPIPFAGGVSTYVSNGAGAAVVFGNLVGISARSTGLVLVADSNFGCIWKIMSSGLHQKMIRQLS